MTKKLPAKSLDSFHPLTLYSLIFSRGGAQQQSKEQTTNSLEGAKKAEKGLKEVQEVLLKSVKDFQEQSVHYGTRLAFASSNEKIATMLLIVFNAIINSLQEQIETLTKSIDKNKKSSETQTQQINQLQSQLSTSYKDYSDLQRLESLFQWWQEMFDETIMKNADDKARETDTSRRRRKR